jgi:hypothetical protein
MDAALRNKRRWTVAPGHTGIDLRTDLHLFDAESASANTRRFSAGHDQLPYAPGNKCAGYL